jgi:hypothetical protein
MGWRWPPERASRTATGPARCRSTFVRNYERLPEHEEATIKRSMIILMGRRLTGYAITRHLTGSQPRSGFGYFSGSGA